MSVNINGGPLTFDFQGNFNQLDAGIKNIEKSLRDLTQTAKSQSEELDSLVKKTTMAIGTYASVASAQNFIGDIIRVRGQFQALEISFRTMLGSKEKADKLMKEATQFAAQTPFTLQEVGAGAKQLLAYGFSAENATKNLEMLGNVAAGVGAPLGDIVYLYGTLRTQGRAYTRDIMQFTSRGIPIVELLAKQFGVTAAEVQNMVEQGKVGFPEIEKAFQSLTNQGGMFFNMLRESSKGLEGLVSNLGDAWAKMLDDIGKDNQSLFEESIKGAISLVENYQDVLDIIKVLIATYGTYRAAIIVTNAVTAISTSLTKGWTIAELLRYRAMVLSDRAMKILNATMLSNPAVAIATGIALLASTLIVFSKNSDKAADAQKRLNGIQNESLQSIQAEKTKLQELLTIAKDETLSKEKREIAIRKINQISPEYLGNLTLENIKTGEATTAINQYIAALERKAQAQAAENALAKISQEQFDKQLELQNKIDKRRRDVGFGRGWKDPRTGMLMTAESFDDEIIREFRSKFEKENAALEKQKSLIKSTYSEALQQQLIGEDKKQGSKKRTVAVIEEDIKALKDQQSQLSTTSKEWKSYQDRIDKLTNEKNSITGDKRAIAKEKKDFKERASNIEQFYNDLINIESEARRSGMLKEQSEIDKINERYAELRKRANELKLGEGVLQRIETARIQQVGNVKEKEAFELYKKSLQDQKTLFDQFEQYKLSVGEEKSRELLGIQKDDFTDYLAYLQAELIKISRSPDASTLGGKLKIQFLTQAVIEEEKRRGVAMIEEQAKVFQEMLSATVTFKDREKQINEKYDKMEQALANDKTIGNKQERLSILKQGREEELKQLQQDAFRQSDIYKKLNEDITLFTRERIKQLIKDLQELLNKSTNIPPVVKKQIEEQIESLQNVLKQTSKGSDIGKDLFKVADVVGQISNAFSSLASSVGEFNKELGESLQGLSDATNIAATTLSAAAKFAAGDIVGGTVDAINAISQIIQGFAEAKRSRIEAEKRVDEFYQRVRGAELEINQIYRERQREQVRLNKLKLDGIEAERKLLLEQKKANEQAYQSILNQIRNEQYVSGQSTITKKNPLALFGGLVGYLSSSRTTTNDVLSSLAGKSYDDLEKLFTSGQLTDKAKELFLQLQKLKQEGVDIDKMLEQNKIEAQQLFTGTTSDNISDAIIEGFKNGKRSASDFADTFEDLMRGAILNALKFKALEGPLKDFYEQFAAFSESDGMLTQQEIEQLRNNFANIIGSAQQQFDQLMTVTNVGFTGSGTESSLSGAIKGITEQQANVLAGQFGGLRITALDILKVARTQLESTLKIQYNTGLTADRINTLLDRLQYYYETVGVKIK